MLHGFFLRTGTGFSFLSGSSVLLSMEEELEHLDWDHRVDAIRSEMQSIVQLNTFKLEVPPPGRSLIS